MYPRTLSQDSRRIKADGTCIVEFGERGTEIWVFVWTWETSTYRRVFVAVLSRFSSDTTSEDTMLGPIIDAAGPDVTTASIHGGPRVFTKAFANCLGNGYRSKLVEYQVFDIRLFERCLQRTAESMFGNLDPFPGRSSWSTVWRVLSFATEWGLDQLSDGPILPTIFRCQAQ